MMPVRSPVDVLCVGLVNVNLLMGPLDERVFVRDVTLIPGVSMIPGGDAVNEAVVLARLGNRAGVAGKVGLDGFAEIAIQSLKAEGLDLSRLVPDSMTSTSVCAVLFRPDGRRHFISHRGANETLSISDLSPSALDGVRVLNIGSMFALKALDGEGAHELLIQARASGIITSADMKADTYGIGYERIRKSMSLLSYFLPSYDEAKYLSGESDPERMAHRFLSDGARRVVIKLGADGCYCAGQGESFYVPGFKVPVVDTTGAGDNFVAGFLHGVLRNFSFEDCALLGCATGAVSVGMVGATTAVRGMEQVEELLSTTKQGRALCAVLREKPWREKYDG